MSSTSTALKRGAAALVFSLTSSLCLADWQLQNSQSQLNFVSVKKSTIAETHRFKELSGSIDKAGNAKISIDLNSADTNIGIRDKRLQTMLFETVKFPAAELTATIDPALFDSLKPGETSSIDLTAELSLHGMTQTLNTAVQVTALSNDQLLVSTLAPVIVKASDFALLEGIEQLKKVAGLPSIATAIPVTAQWIFKKQ